MTNITTNGEAQNCQAKLFKLKCNLLKISINSQTEFAATTHLAVGQWAEEQLNVENFRLFQGGTRQPTASRTEGQNLAPLKTFINASNIRFN
jgi:hypothetical protein